MGIQGILNQYGYYNGQIDGVFGNVTEQSLKNYQKATGVLKVDGVAGPLTKSFVLRKRYGNKDVDDEDIRKIYMLRGEEIYLTFFIANIPPTLWQNKREIRKEIGLAFLAWSDAICDNSTFIRFVLSDKAESADILIKWTDQSETNLFQYDGIEGDVGEIKIIDDKQVLIDLNINQQWTLNAFDDRIGDTKVTLLPAMIHLIGNAIGLPHSNQSEDVMSPFYDADKIQFSLNDVGRIKDLFREKRSRGKHTKNTNVTFAQNRTFI